MPDTFTKTWIDPVIFRGALEDAVRNITGWVDQDLRALDVLVVLLDLVRGLQCAVEETQFEMR